MFGQSSRFIQKTKYHTFQGHYENQNTLGVRFRIQLKGMKSELDIRFYFLVSYFEVKIKHFVKNYA